MLPPMIPYRKLKSRLHLSTPCRAVYKGIARRVYEKVVPLGSTKWCNYHTINHARATAVMLPQVMVDVGYW